MTKVGRIIAEEIADAERATAKATARTIVVRMLKSGKLTAKEIVSYVPEVSVKEVKKIEEELLHESL